MKQTRRKFDAKFKTNVDIETIKKEKDQYLRKIVDLEMQLDFAKRSSRKLRIEIPADD